MCNVLSIKEYKNKKAIDKLKIKLNALPSWRKADHLSRASQFRTLTYEELSFLKEYKSGELIR
jgi:hypothetical protein